MLYVDTLPFMAHPHYKPYKQKRKKDRYPRFMTLLYSKLRSLCLNYARCRHFYAVSAFLVAFQQLPWQWSQRFHPQSDFCCVDPFQTFSVRCGEGEVVELLIVNVDGEVVLMWVSAQNDDGTMAATTGGFINQASSRTPVHVYTPCDYLVTLQWGM